MKREDAIRQIDEFISDNHTDLHANYFLDFIEHVIGMRPPIYETKHESPEGVIYWSGTTGMEWEPSEREFQSKKDSCI